MPVHISFVLILPDCLLSRRRHGGCSQELVHGVQLGSHPGLCAAVKSPTDCCQDHSWEEVEEVEEDSCCQRYDQKPVSESQD